MKKLVIAVCFVLGSTQAMAEKISCIDTKKKEHVVEFVANTLDIVYVDDVEYFYQSEPSGKLVYYGNPESLIKFVIDKNNRDFFQIIKINASKDGKEPKIEFKALCDNVNVIEEQQSTLINYP